MKRPWCIKNYKKKFFRMDGRYKKKKNQRRKYTSQICLSVDDPEE